MKTTANWYLVRRDLEAALDHLFCLPPENFVEYDSLLSVEEFDALGYARNFPHLTCLLCALDVEHLPAFAAGDRRVDERYGPSRTSMALLPATCYKAIWSARGRALPHRRWWAASPGALGTRTSRSTATAATTSL